MRRIKTFTILAAGLLTLGQARAAEPIRPAEFAQLHRLIKPAPGEEQWNRIPWLEDLWDARRQAAEQGKPILLWEMDGNPLGCT